MKKKCLLLLLIIISINSFTQDLTIKETITYINQSIRENRKIELTSEGLFIYSGLNNNSNKPFSYEIHISDIDTIKIKPPSSGLLTSLESENPWAFIISCDYRYEGEGVLGRKKIGGDCVLNKHETYESYGTFNGWKLKTSHVDYIEIVSKDGAEYSTQKLINAVSYLIEKIKEKGLDVRQDNDPFAPQNYKSSATINKSDKNTEQTKKNLNQEDIEFAPYLGKTTSITILRNGPSSTNVNIKTLIAGSTIYVYSNKSINGFYKVIDIMSSQIGWVDKNSVLYKEKVEISEKEAFQSTGYISSYNSEVSINNKSTHSIVLVVGSETFTLIPKSSKRISVKPGRIYYIATAPGVIPLSGYQSFQSNNGYEWEFWVGKK